MRRATACLIAAISVGTLGHPQSGFAQTVTGNRANGLNYQPTPAEVAPREQAAGVRPSSAQEAASNKDLERIDRDLLRSHGLSTSSVPKLSAGQ